MTEVSVVLGAAGFLGSHLVENLLNEGKRVIGVDDLSSGKLENISHLVSRKEFDFWQLDVRKPIDIDCQVSVVYNLASLASPKAYLGDPIHTLLTGSEGSTHALDLARRKAARYIYFSTSEVYGDPLVHPQTESYWGNVNPIGVRSCYDEAKRFGEALTMAYFREFGLDAGIVRIFNTYGPRLQPGDGRVISNFIVQALKGMPLTVYGDGSQTRSFCYVEDLIRGIRSFTESEHLGPVNLGNPTEMSIVEVATVINELTGNSCPLTYATLPSDDPSRRRPDVSLARQLLGWEPEVEIRSGLLETIAWFRTVTK